MSESAPKQEKTVEEILKMTGKISFPAYEGWHPAGTSPEHQHMPKLSLEGMLFDEPLDKDNCVVLNGTKFRVVWDAKAPTADSQEEGYDGSYEGECKLELAE